MGSGTMALITLLEVALLAGVLCFAHRLSDRVGFAPLYLLVGLLEVFLFAVSKPSEPIRLAFYGVDARGMYILFLAPLFGSVALVYVLEGTRAARRLIGGLAFLYVVHGVVDVSIAWHANNPPPGFPAQPDIDFIRYSIHARAASLIAMVANFVVLLIVYQGIVNKAPRIPLAAPLFLGMVAAMVTDAFVFRIVRSFTADWSVLFVGAKAQAGAAVAVPIAAYCAWRIRTSPEEVREGILNRGALDIVDLRARVQEMQESLRDARAQYLLIKDTFSRYVSPDVVDQIVADPTKIRLGGELRDVTILFADIRGYSSLSELLGPTEIIDLLNIYFRRVSAVIFKHKGMINEFEGDAVLAVFGAPLDMPDHAERAVYTALDMLIAVEELNEVWAEDGTLQKWQAAGIEELAIRIGVHSGPVVAGNIGSEQRIKYAVIGDTVNTASRVEGLNKVLKTSLLITQATVDELGDSPVAATLEAAGSHAVKGREQEVVVYSSSST